MHTQGVEDVKRHLEDVDNVPLLVSLFTDVTRESTSDMVRNNLKRIITHYKDLSNPLHIAFKVKRFSRIS